MKSTIPITVMNIIVIDVMKAAILYNSVLFCYQYYYYYIDDNDINHWPELLQFLFNCCNLDIPHMYESALQIVR